MKRNLVHRSSVSGADSGSAVFQARCLSRNTSIFTWISGEISSSLAGWEAAEGVGGLGEVAAGTRWGGPGRRPFKDALPHPQASRLTLLLSKGVCLPGLTTAPAPLRPLRLRKAPSTSVTPKPEAPCGVRGLGRAADSPSSTNVARPHPEQHKKCPGPACGPATAGANGGEPSLSHQGWWGLWSAI